MHPDALSEVPNDVDAFGSSQNNDRNKSRMLEIFKDFDPRLVALLDMAESSSVRLWQLLDMNPPPTRQKERLGLVGDAALPFLPHIGQGAACALEDAASIMALFGPGIRESDISERLQLYEECRKSRAEEIHSFSRLLGRDLEAGNEDAKLNRDLMTKKYFPYIFGHDEFDHSIQKLREHEYRKTPNMWSMPTSFGPMPKLDQTQSDEDCTTYISSTIKFKTSKNMLQKLMPKVSLTYASIGSVALASFTHIQHSNVRWLSGQSYNELAFYIHSVKDEKQSDGSSSDSRFLAVSFVDSADVLARSRDDPGIPMVFCNFDIVNLGDQRQITAHWNKKKFCHMKFTNMKSATIEEPDTDQAVLTHRYFPGMNASAPPAADSIIRVTRRSSDQPGTLRKKACEDSTLNVINHTPQELPTLHHILSHLADLPILAIVDSHIVHGSGSFDFDHA